MASVLNAMIHNARPRLMCAVCGHPVEKITVERDFVTDNILIGARCHGETWRFTIRVTDFEDTPAAVREILMGGVIGIAFGNVQGHLIPENVGPLSDCGSRWAQALNAPDVAETDPRPMLALPAP